MDQHLIAEWFMKQWADASGCVGVVCTIHRGWGLVGPGGLHHVVDHWPKHEDEAWGHSIEEPAARAVRAFDGGLRAGGIQQAEAVLAYDSGHLNAILDFMALHRARAADVILRRQMYPEASPEQIADRLADAQRRLSRCGVQISVQPNEAPSLPLGSFPVFDASKWGGWQAGTADLAMPITPRAVCSASPDLPAGTAQVVDSELDLEGHATMHLAGEPGWLAAPFLICRPKEAEQVAGIVGSMTAGGVNHWTGLTCRFTLAETKRPSRISPQMRTAWKARRNRWERNTTLLGSPDCTTPVAERMKADMAGDAQKSADELADMGVGPCGCDAYRNMHDTPLWKNLWSAVMPTGICQLAHSQHWNCMDERP